MDWFRRGKRYERAQAAAAAARAAEWGGGPEGEALADLHIFRDEVLALTALPRTSKSCCRTWPSAGRTSRRSAPP